MRNGHRPQRNWWANTIPTLDDLRDMNEASTRATIQQILTGQAYVYHEIGEDGVDNDIPGRPIYEDEVDLPIETRTQFDIERQRERRKASKFDDMIGRLKRKHEKEMSKELYAQQKARRRVVHGYAKLMHITDDEAITQLRMKGCLT